MHRIAAKIAEEVVVLLQHGYVNTGSCEQIAQHHAGRAASNDATGGGYSLVRHALFSLKQKPARDWPTGPGLISTEIQPRLYESEDELPY
jgi:hypothetical protein